MVVLPCELLTAIEPGSRNVWLPIPSMMDHPLRSISVVPVFNNSIHSPSGDAFPSLVETGIISLNPTDPVAVMVSRGGIFVAFGDGYVDFTHIPPSGFSSMENPGSLLVQLTSSPMLPFGR